MKTVKNLLFAAATMATFAACSNDEMEQFAPAFSSNEIIPVSRVEAQTRAAQNLQATALAEGKQVGFFVVDATSTATDPTVLYDNIQYTTAAGGTFTAAGTKMYFPVENPISIYSYAPYKSGITCTSTAGNKFSVNTDQSTDDNYIASDLLIGAPKSNSIEKTSEEIEVAYTHMLSKINLNLSISDESLASLAGAKVKITNVATNCTFDVTCGGCISVDASTTGDVLAAVGADDAKTINTAAIIMPQTVKKGTKLFTVEVSEDKCYEYVATDDMTFEGKKVYTYNMSVSAAATKMAVSLKSVVTDWESGNGDGDDLEATPGAPAPRTAHVGDWYLADGTYANGAESAPANTIGVVFSLDAPDGYSALVSALCDPMKNTKWAAADDALLTTALVEESAFVTSGSACANLLNGYDLTQTIKTHASYANFLAFNGSLEATDFNAGGKYAAPATSTKWYVPAIGEMMKLIEYFTGAEWVSDSKSNTCGTGYTLSANYAAAIEGLSNAFPQSGGTYWTVSEKDASNVWVVIPNNASASSFKSNSKTTNNGCRTHLILAAK